QHAKESFLHFDHNPKWSGSKHQPRYCTRPVKPDLSFRRPATSTDDIGDFLYDVPGVELLLKILGYKGAGPSDATLRTTMPAAIFAPICSANCRSTDGPPR